MKKINSVIFVVAVTVFLVVAVALTRMKTTTVTKGLVDIKAQSHILTSVETDNAQAAADAANAETDASASESDKGTSDSGSSSNSGSSSASDSSSSSSSSLLSGATSNDISLTSKGNATVNTTGEMPKTGENDAVFFGMGAVVLVGIFAFAKSKSLRVK